MFSEEAVKILLQEKGGFLVYDGCNEIDLTLYISLERCWKFRKVLKV